MNSKRAKRLRQLVRHLQNKGGIGDSPWEVAAIVNNGPVASLQDIVTSDDVAQQTRLSDDTEQVETPQYKKPTQFSGIPLFKTEQRVLDPACGKSIYRTMKFRALLSSKK